MENYLEVKQELTDIEIELANKVSQQECENRRKELRMSFESLQHDLSKLVGINKVHTEQIGNIRSLIHWLAGITGTILAAVLLLVIKGALNI